MPLLIVGILLFFAAHSVRIVCPGWRDKMVLKLGDNGWKGLYSLVAAAGLVLIIVGYSQARMAPTVLYVPPTWLRHITLLLMVPVFPLLLATYLPGRIKRATKHPMLIATKTWALAHLLANGMLADVLLFGAFLAWAVADRISLKRRPDSPTPSLDAGKFNDLIAVGGGLALYIAFVMGLHTLLIGVPPIPGMGG